MLRLAPIDHSGTCKDMKMMSHQVGRHAEPRAHLAWRCVAKREHVSDRQARRIAERGVHPCAYLNIRRLSIH
jgi:hypothetical protein